jgi:hypothetical protein
VLRALTHFFFQRHMQSMSSEDIGFLQSALLSKDSFREYLWPLRTGIDSDVRAALWKFIAAGTRQEGMAKLWALPCATYITGGSAYETDTNVRAQHLVFIETALANPPFSAVANGGDAVAVLAEKLRNEHNKGLYPRPPGGMTDVQTGD